MRLNIPSPTLWNLTGKMYYIRSRNSSLQTRVLVPVILMIGLHASHSNRLFSIASSVRCELEQMFLLLLHWCSSSWDESVPDHFVLFCSCYGVRKIILSKGNLSALFLSFTPMLVCKGRSHTEPNASSKTESKYNPLSLCRIPPTIYSEAPEVQCNKKCFIGVAKWEPPAGISSYFCH